MSTGKEEPKPGLVIPPDLPKYDLPDYEDLARWIETAPLTWLPDILARAVTAAEKQDVFQTGGMERFISRIREAAKCNAVKLNTKTAYLIALFDRETHELLYSTIWSDPPWQQTMVPQSAICAVLFAVNAESYQAARDRMIEHVLRQPFYQAMFGPAVIAKFQDGSGRTMDLTTRPPKPE